MSSPERQLVIIPTDITPLVFAVPFGFTNKLIVLLRFFFFVITLTAPSVTAEVVTTTKASILYLFVGLFTMVNVQKEPLPGHLPFKQAVVWEWSLKIRDWTGMTASG